MLLSQVNVFDCCSTGSLSPSPSSVDWYGNQISLQSRESRDFSAFNVQVGRPLKLNDEEELNKLKSSGIETKETSRPGSSLDSRFTIPNFEIESGNAPVTMPGDAQKNPGHAPMTNFYQTSSLFGRSSDPGSNVEEAINERKILYSPQNVIASSTSPSSLSTNLPRSEPQQSVHQLSKPQGSDPRRYEVRYSDLPLSESQYSNPQRNKPQYGGTQGSEPRRNESQYSGPPKPDPQYGESQYSEPLRNEFQRRVPRQSELQYSVVERNEPKHSDPQTNESQYISTRRNKPQYSDPQGNDPQYIVLRRNELQYSGSPKTDPQYGESQYREPLRNEFQRHDPRQSELQYSVVERNEPERGNLQTKQYNGIRRNESQYGDPQGNEPQYVEPRRNELQYSGPPKTDPQYGESQYREPLRNEFQRRVPRQSELQYSVVERYEPQRGDLQTKPYSGIRRNESQYGDPQGNEPLYSSPRRYSPQNNNPRRNDPQYGESQNCELQQNELQRNVQRSGELLCVDPQSSEPSELQYSVPEKYEPRRGGPQRNKPQYSSTGRNESQYSDLQGNEPRNSGPQRNESQRREQQQSEPKHSKLSSTSQYPLVTSVYDPPVTLIPEATIHLLPAISSASSRAMSTHGASNRENILSLHELSPRQSTLNTSTRSSTTRPVQSTSHLTIPQPTLATGLNDPSSSRNSAASWVQELDPFSTVPTSEVLQLPASELDIDDSELDPDLKMLLRDTYPCHHPKNNAMVYLSQRLASFKVPWPENQSVSTITEAANAGFYYLGG